MKIISNFVDYYDHYQDLHLSIEPSIIYLRKTQTVDAYTSSQIQEKLNCSLDQLKVISSSIIKPDWILTPFIVGVAGKINHGLKIQHGHHIEFSYTLSGGLYLPKKMDIHLTPKIIQLIEQHFEKPFFNQSDLFQLISSPAFVLMPNLMNVINTVVNPHLQSLGYFKVSSSRDTYHQMKTFINNVLIPENDLQKYSSSRKEPRILGLEHSGWVLHDGMPHGY